MSQHIKDYIVITQNGNQESKYVNKDAVSTEQAHSQIPEKLEAQKQHTENHPQASQKTMENAHHKIIFDPYKKSYHDYIKIQLQAREREKDKLVSNQKINDQNNHTSNQPIKAKHQDFLIDDEKTIQNESSHIIVNDDQPKMADKKTEETAIIVIKPAEILQKQAQQSLVYMHIQIQQLQKTIQHIQDIVLNQHLQKMDSESIKPIQQIQQIQKSNKEQQIQLVKNQAAETIRDDQKQNITPQEQQKLLLSLQQNKKLQNHEYQQPKDGQRGQQSYIKKPLVPQDIILNFKLNSEKSLPLESHCVIQQNVKEKEQIVQQREKDDQIVEKTANEKELIVGENDQGLKLSIDSSKEKSKSKIQKKSSGNPSTCSSCEII